MNQKMNSQLLQFDKSMRHAATDAENLLWQLLSANALWCSNLDVRR